MICRSQSHQRLQSFHSNSRGNGTSVSWIMYTHCLPPSLCINPQLIALCPKFSIYETHFGTSPPAYAIIGRIDNHTNRINAINGGGDLWNYCYIFTWYLQLFVNFTQYFNCLFGSHLISTGMSGIAPHIDRVYSLETKAVLSTAKNRYEYKYKCIKWLLWKRVMCYVVLFRKICVKYYIFSVSVIA